MREGGGGEVGLCSSSDRFRDNSGPLSLIQQATRMARRTGKAPKRKGTPTKCWFCEKTDGEREGERERERERNKKHKIPSFNKQTSVMYIHSPLTVEQICSHSAYEQQ